MDHKENNHMPIQEESTLKKIRLRKCDKESKDPPASVYFCQLISSNLMLFSHQLIKMTEKCFKKCISKPGTSLDSSEQKCVAMCMDRYMDSFNLVSKTYSERLQRERNRM
ncbi:Mitochondrial import inner membrane translocase subunit Tim13-B [Trachymyrmex zeteki]|uniref:Mitochondrial import inner membrane translocase subunit n=1 Tax=Mycetomoellerius zeteki TaxID=64791 RepID=A0A151WIC8_9HYME|nr:Mitochondrial import inner membrane translocase subunit Tim13-B [Trachymyrmex zeteki]